MHGSLSRSRQDLVLMAELKANVLFQASGFHVSYLTNEKKASTVQIFVLYSRHVWMFDDVTGNHYSTNLDLYMLKFVYTPLYACTSTHCKSFVFLLNLPILWNELSVIFIILFHPINRRTVHVKPVGEMTIFWAVKHVLMPTIPSVYFHHWKLLFLMTGDALNVYAPITLLGYI